MVWSFLKKYDDERIVLCAENALERENILNTNRLAVSSKEGIVALDGRTHSRIVKNRASLVVRNSLIDAGVRYHRIVDNIILA